MISSKKIFSNKPLLIKFPIILAKHISLSILLSMNNLSNLVTSSHFLEWNFFSLHEQWNSSFLNFETEIGIERVFPSPPQFLLQKGQ